MSTPPPLKADFDEIQRSVALFLEPGGCVELRAPKTARDGVISGYFTDPEAMAKAAFQVSGRAPGIYTTLNPVGEVLLSRAANRVKSRAAELTRDSEIEWRRWLLLDCDPKRPAGISSSEGEHAAALDLARVIGRDLALQDWPVPVLADSGNGAHLLYRIDLPNDDRSKDLVKNVLKACAARYDNERVSVDLSVFNAARISKIYGTLSQKGDSTEERPHRLSRILHLPDDLQPVSIFQLDQLAATARTEPRAGSAEAPRAAGKPLPEFDLEKFIREHGIAIDRGPDVHDGSERWRLAHCPFNPDHKAPDAAIWRQLGTGRLGFKCLHASCEGKGWKEFREFYQPKRTFRQDVGSAIAASSASEPKSDGGDKIPVSAAAVEASADAVIAADDIEGLLRLTEQIAALRPLDRAVITAKFRSHFKRRFPTSEYRKLLKKAVESSAPPAPPPEDDDGTVGDGPDLLSYPLTDTGNGERIVAMFGSDMRWCIEMERWLIWDGSRWKPDDLKDARQKAKAVFRRLHDQASRAGLAVVEKHARASESYAGITAALGCASSERGIPISASQLDQHPYLLNCPNGVVDLRSMKLLPHSRDFLITKLCPVRFNPEAKASRFVNFVEWAMGGNPDSEITQRTARLVSFLQRAFGYALTSSVDQKALFVFYGAQGNNGKTTLLETFRTMLGSDYTAQLQIDTIMSIKRADAGARADLADLRGARFVVTSEVEKESRLNEGLIKYLTGMATVKTCRKYENPIEFPPTHKIFMDCNYRPRVRDGDPAIWRRLKLIPFEVTVTDEQKDASLSQKLASEFEGILAWAVRGARDWYRSGLGEPPEVSDANTLWREEDDPLKEFLEDACEVGEEYFCRVSEMVAAYEWWAKSNGEKFPLGRKDFNARLIAKGFTQLRSRRIDGEQARTWEGVKVRDVVVANSGAQFARSKNSHTWMAEK
jgi:P4 family phage/plasmid primase-like protien